MKDYDYVIERGIPKCRTTRIRIEIRTIRITRIRTEARITRTIRTIRTIRTEIRITIPETTDATKNNSFRDAA